MTLNQLLTYAVRTDCSDVHITAGTNLAIRRYGVLSILADCPTAEESTSMIYELLDMKQIERVNSGEDLDIGVMLPDGTRIRANIYHQRNNLAASIRILQQVIPSFEELGLPSVVKDLAEMPRGLVLVTGPTGSGKSTTLASMVDYINKNHARHVMTIEDPIEYVYPHNQAMIHQREVGKDAKSFASALRSALREDPDVILVGEMRDYETISAAVAAAETGHLVLSTLHTTGAAQTVERIIDACPTGSQNQIRIQLAAALKGIVSQCLIPCGEVKGAARIAGTELLVATDAILNLIREGKTHQISAMMQAGGNAGMHTLNMDLSRLMRQGYITKERAREYTNNPAELEQYMM